MSDFKRCPRCGHTKRRSEFYVLRRAVDGLQVWCKECQKTAPRAARVPRPSVIRERVETVHVWGYDEWLKEARERPHNVVSALLEANREIAYLTSMRASA